jgi:pimeloyl-ACP methyl ester carboxylesterase
VSGGYELRAFAGPNPVAQYSQRPALWRTAAEAAAMIGPAWKLPLGALILQAPDGDGHAILTLPGLFHGDAYTAVMRQFLNALGYSAYGWNLGVNIGPTRRLLDGASDRLIRLSDRFGPLSVVGFSMGGLFARWLSLKMPDRIRQVITVCSPIHERAKNFWLPLDGFITLWPDLSSLARDVARPLPVPGTFLFSRDDGLVNCNACRDTNASAEDNVEIHGPHVTIARNARVMTVVAQRLARKLAHA